MPKDSVRHQRFNSSSNPGFSAYTYDAAGNMTNDGFHSYTYDAEGNILTVDNGATAQYVYDALNRRVRSQTSASTYEYMYDYAGRRTSSWKNPSTGNPGFGDEARIYWDGRQIAYRAYDGTTYFDHQDWLGTERMRTNYQGQVAQKFQSLPWGDGAFGSYGGNGPVQDNLAFAGLDFDTESGTDHAQFRNYSPAQGRWLSPDPYDGSYDLINPQSLNRYAYVLNNPLSFIDPSGQDCYTIGGDTWTIDSGDGTVTTGFDPGTTVCTNPSPSWPCQEYGYLYCGMGNGPAGGNAAPTPAKLATLSAPNNGECDNACQLAQALGKTGVYSLNSPCAVPAFYASSAAIAAGALVVANIGEVAAVVTENFATLLSKVGTALYKGSMRTPIGPSVPLMATTAVNQISQACK